MIRTNCVAYPPPELNQSYPNRRRVPMAVLVTKPAPDFVAPAVMADGSVKENISLSSLRGKYLVVMFRDRGVELVGGWIDWLFTYAAWRNTPVNKGGIGPVGFPIVADVKHEITRAYGIEHPDGVALRGSFLIDRQGIVQHQVVNNLPLGREVDEMLRMVDALQFFEENGEVCPAGWHKGQAAMKPDAAGVADYLAKHAGEL